MAKAAKLETSLERVLAMRHPTAWFRAHLDAYYEQSEKPRVDPGWFHPSGLSHPCDALLAFQYLGLPPRNDGKISSKLRRIFDNGHSTEARWQAALQRSGIALLGKKKGDRNFEIAQFHIRGEMDNVIRHPQTGEKFVWEMKTKREDLFDRMTAPDLNWIPQVHCYMFAAGILQTLIVVECKNCQDYKEFLVKFDGGIWKGITDRVTMIRERVEAHQELARTPQPRDSECDYYPICSGWDFGKGAEQLEKR